MCVGYLYSGWKSFVVEVGEGYLAYFVRRNESFWMVPGTYED